MHRHESLLPLLLLLLHRALADQDDDERCVEGDWAQGACHCRPDFAGVRCDIPVCRFGHLGPGGVCLCNLGYGGRFCEVPDPKLFATTADPAGACLHGLWLSLWSRCRCESGWAGDACERRVCENGGQLLGDVHATCLCDRLHFGLSCEHSKCVNGIAFKNMCHCGSGYTGKFCEDMVCLNGGVFNRTLGRCKCQLRFRGDHCQKDFVCLHGLQHGRRCICEANWRGRYCDICRFPLLFTDQHLKTRVSSLTMSQAKGHLPMETECVDPLLTPPVFHHSLKGNNRLSRTRNRAADARRRDPDLSRNEWISSGFLSTTAVIMVGLGIFCASDAIRRRANGEGGAERRESSVSAASSTRGASSWSLYSLRRFCSPPPAYEHIPNSAAAPPTYEDATKPQLVAADSRDSQETHYEDAVDERYQGQVL